MVRAHARYRMWELAFSGRCFARSKPKHSDSAKKIVLLKLREEIHHTARSTARHFQQGQSFGPSDGSQVYTIASFLQHRPLDGRTAQAARSKTPTTSEMKYSRNTGTDFTGRTDALIR